MCAQGAPRVRKVCAKGSPRVRKGRTGGSPKMLLNLERAKHLPCCFMKGGFVEGRMEGGGCEGEGAADGVFEKNPKIHFAISFTDNTLFTFLWKTSSVTLSHKHGPCCLCSCLLLFSHQNRFWDEIGFG